MADSDRSITGTGPGTLGTGHPNKFLQCDLAELTDGKPQWNVRLETLIPIDEPMRATVEKQLASNNKADKKAVATYLTGKVPPGRDPEAAMRMVAGAFGFDYPLDRTDTGADKTLGATSIKRGPRDDELGR